MVHHVPTRRVVHIRRRRSRPRKRDAASRLRRARHARHLDRCSGRRHHGAAIALTRQAKRRHLVGVCQAASQAAHTARCRHEVTTVLTAVVRHHVHSTASAIVPVHLVACHSLARRYLRSRP